MFEFLNNNFYCKRNPSFPRDSLTFQKVIRDQFLCKKKLTSDCSFLEQRPQNRKQPIKHESFHAIKSEISFLHDWSQSGWTRVEKKIMIMISQKAKAVYRFTHLQHLAHQGLGLFACRVEIFARLHKWKNEPNEFRTLQIDSNKMSNNMFPWTTNPTRLKPWNKCLKKTKKKRKEKKWRWRRTFWRRTWRSVM